MFLRLLGFVLSIALLVFVIFQKKIRKWGKVGLVVVALFLVLFMAYLNIFPRHPAPHPTGDMVVRTDTVFYRYESNLADMLTHGNEREIPIKVWYPDGAEENQHPLLIFSPGSFGTAESNETMYLELASRGYVVMGISHPYHSFSSKMSDGRTIRANSGFLWSVVTSEGVKNMEGNLASLREWTQVRIDDINVILDKLLDAQIDNEYESLIDRERIVLSGHSLGGAAALAVGRDRCEEIRAMVVLEAPFARDIIGIDGDQYVFTDEAYPLPILHVYSDSLITTMDEIATYEMNVRLLHSDNPMYVNKHISGVGHLGLTDMALLSPILTNMLDRGADTRKAPETLLELNRYVLEFLDEFVSASTP